MKVTLVMAITLDGKIGKDSNHFPDWTGKADKKFFVSETKSAGCMIMGRKTYDTIGRPLPKRKNVVMPRNPIATDHDLSLLEYTDKDPATLLQQLALEGLDHVVLAGGAQINTLFAKAGLIDELALTISPLVFGAGISVFNEVVELPLTLTELTTLDENLVLVRYKVQK